MRTIEEIKSLRDQGSRKWGKDLYLHICPWVDDFMSMEEISRKLSNEHGLEATTDQLDQVFRYYRRKFNTLPSVPASPPPSQKSGTVAQKQEASQLSAPSDYASRPKRNYDFDEDFRTPAPKPTSIFSTKTKAPDQ